MTTYTWNLEFKTKIVDKLGNDAIVVNYSVTGNDGVHTVTFPTSCVFEPDATLTNVPFEELTDDMILTWAKVQPNASVILAQVDSSLAALH
jgi:hypothetical protein